MNKRDIELPEPPPSLRRTFGYISLGVGAFFVVMLIIGASMVTPDRNLTDTQRAVIDQMELQCYMYELQAPGHGLEERCMESVESKRQDMLRGNDVTDKDVIERQAVIDKYDTMESNCRSTSFSSMADINRCLDNVDTLREMNGLD